MAKLVLIDGHAILHRAYHAYPPLTTAKGELIGAVYGFTSILLSVLAKLHPKYAAVAFDKKEPTFRHKKFKAYKAHRPKMDEELIGQIKRVHQVVRILNIPIFEIDGYEADDVIGTLARQASLPKLKAKSLRLKAKSENLEVIIVTGDQDALQLVDDKVKVFMPGRGKQPEKIYDCKAILERYGLKPFQIIDFKALAGDASDGIPGVSGIGPKTAVKLIREIGGVREIYKKLDKIQGPVAKKLTADKNNAFLSRELAEIDRQVPIELDLKCCQLSDYDRSKALQLFKRLQFRSLMKKLPGDEGSELEKETAEKVQTVKQMGLF